MAILAWDQKAADTFSRISSRSAVPFGVLRVIFFTHPARAGEADVPLPMCDTGEPVEIDAAVKVGDLRIDNQNIFRLDDPAENNIVFRGANKLHIKTREHVISDRVLLHPGDPFSLQLARETERLVRAPDYIYDDHICVRKIADGRVDLELTTRDVWTLRPGISASRKGGANSGGMVLQERNLLGQGIAVAAGYTTNVDRNSTLFNLKDPNILDTWISGNFHVENNSDGNVLGLSLALPFYALDSKNAWDLNYFDGTQNNSIYDLGEIVDEYRQEQSLQRADYGWSKGLQDGWVRRYTLGIERNVNEFTEVTGSDMSTLIPEDRYFQYPFIGVELLQDHFEMARNRDDIGRTEDFYLGSQISASLGLLSETLGSDRNGLLLHSNWAYKLPFGDQTRWLTDGGLATRVEQGNGLINTLITGRLRIYHRQSERRLLYVLLEAAFGQDLDLDNLLELGGDSGLRGYPLRYQTGETRTLLTVEQRYFTSWYPFRLFYVGAAAFFDAGQMRGNGPTGEPNLGLLRDVGIGLRFASSRSSEGTMIHIDLAKPLDGDSSIANFQINVEAKKSF